MIFRTVTLFMLLFGSFAVLGCKSEKETVELKLRIDSSKQVLVPQTKEELISFIKGNLDERVLNEFISLKPWDVLFSENMLESIFEMLYFKGFPDRILGLLDYPFISDRRLNPIRVLCVYAYSELKSVSIEEFHLMVIRDARFDKEKRFEKALEKDIPWWNDSNVVNQKVHQPKNEIKKDTWD